MALHSHPAVWIEVIGWLSLSIAFASALIIGLDILRGYRQKMWIMNLVYPITALYWGPVAVWFYFKHGKRKSKPVIERLGPPDSDQMPQWIVLGKAVSHCGAGCTLGDIAGEWLVAALGLTIGGKAMLADFPMDFGWAWTLGVVFQYFTIVPMRDVGKLKGIWLAIKADTLSIVAFQAGLFGGMAVYQELIFPPGLPKDTATYWMMMQLSMILGFFTAWPVNRWLVKRGFKEKM
ncbi:MAG TPA: DUF4396 domain-containing protein [Gammaproteobacteria bacterium]|nr:DUF4396 domain-containing protein [Gammaproteobacteria bacterium]